MENHVKHVQMENILAPFNSDNSLLPMGVIKNQNTHHKLNNIYTNSSPQKNSNLSNERAISSNVISNLNFDNDKQRRILLRDIERKKKFKGIMDNKFGFDENNQISSIRSEKIDVVKTMIPKESVRDIAIKTMPDKNINRIAENNSGNKIGRASCRERV